MKTPSHGKSLVSPVLLFLRLREVTPSISPLIFSTTVNDVFLEIEVQGALQVMKKCPEALSIFLIPPSLEELERRLRNRGTETEEVLQKRLEKAKEEMKFTGQFKYTVVNDDVDIAVRKLKALILGARQ